jgi:TetR/AcrR family transcriptional repressor of nem operon
MSKPLARQPLTHKQRLVREGLRQFRSRGFHGTTVDDLLAAAEAPKGSFYHHFGTKEEFAREVVEAYVAVILENLALIAGKEGETGLARIEDYFHLTLLRFSAGKFRAGCLVGSLSTELAPDSDFFREILGSALGRWRLAIKKLVDEGQHDGSIRDDMSSAQLSHVLLALLQGGLTVSVANRTRDTFAEVEKSLAKLIRSPSA